MPGLPRDVLPVLRGRDLRLADKRALRRLRVEEALRMTRKTRSRKAFEREARTRFDLTAKQARELRRLFEKHTGTEASKAELLRHPRIAGKHVEEAREADRLKRGAGVAPGTSLGRGSFTRGTSKQKRQTKVRF